MARKPTGAELTDQLKSVTRELNAHQIYMWDTARGIGPAHVEDVTIDDGTGAPFRVHVALYAPKRACGGVVLVRIWPKGECLTDRNACHLQIRYLDDYAAACDKMNEPWELRDAVRRLTRARNEDASGAVTAQQRAS